MRRLLIALGAALAALVVLATPAFAHPLGNFTINHYSRVEVAGSQLRVLYILDLAEIPAFQEQQRIQADPHYLDHKVAELARGLRLEVDGQAVALRAGERVLSFHPGQGGLQTMRLEVLFTAPAPGPGSHMATYEDRNYQGRLGWSEIVVEASGGAALETSSAPQTSVSDELRHYPQDLLTSPLHVTRATFTFTPGVAAVRAPSLLGASGLAAFQDRFAALITSGASSPLPILAALAAALGLGILHALEPGHGKAVMAGYLVGTRGRRRDAVGLGLTITATHTAGVFALGGVTVLAAGWLTPERLYPWLTLISGLLVVAVGVWLAASRLRGWRQDLAHRHAHEHGHDHAHPSHDAKRGRLGVLLLGVSGGLIPCPAALVVLLAAISLHRVAFGMLLIVGFSAGLALALTGIGVALAGGMPLLRRVAARLRPQTGPDLARLLPLASAVVVTALGIGLCAQALEVL